MNGDNGIWAEERLLDWAREVSSQDPDWVQFHFAVFGPGGAVETVYPDRKVRQSFLASAHGRELVNLMAALRIRQTRGKTLPNVTVTIRVPKPIHQSLMAEAKERNISLHRLCLDKLVQPFTEPAEILTTRSAK